MIEPGRPLPVWASLCISGVPPHREEVSSPSDPEQWQLLPDTTLSTRCFFFFFFYFVLFVRNLI